MIATKWRNVNNPRRACKPGVECLIRTSALKELNVRITESIFHLVQYLLLQVLFCTLLQM
jgi:hypothetical protein